MCLTTFTQSQNENRKRQNKSFGPCSSIRKIHRVRSLRRVVVDSVCEQLKRRTPAANPVTSFMSTRGKSFYFYFLFIKYLCEIIRRKDPVTYGRPRTPSTIISRARRTYGIIILSIVNIIVRKKRRTRTCPVIKCNNGCTLHRFLCRGRLRPGRNAQFCR